MRRDVETILAEIADLESRLTHIRRTCSHVAVQIKWAGDRYWHECVACGHLVRRAPKADVQRFVFDDQEVRT